jgi:hypothetical protein
LAEYLEASEPDDAWLEEWAAHVGYRREAYLDALVARGFTLTKDKSRGTHSDAELSNGRVTVLLDDGFPYIAPRVWSDVGPMSWHRDRRGFLCLYTTTDRGGRPWCDVDGFMARIEEWFEKNDAGWPDDPPALDLEAYLDLPLDPRYVLYTNLDRHTDQYTRFRDYGNQLRLDDSGKLATNSTKRMLSGYVTDIGEVTTPPHNWDDLMASVAEPEKIRRAIRRDRVDVLLIQYRRSNQHGVLVVTFLDSPATAASRKTSKRGRQRRRTDRERGDTRHPHLALSGSADEAVMRLRSGITAAALKDKHVYVIGAGAIGSHICDGLVRAGLGQLTVRDHQLLTPGNLTRHLITNLDCAGYNKACVVQVVLDNRPYCTTRIDSEASALTTPAEAMKLLNGYDLVVDATADGSVTSMLEAASAVTGTRFATACLQNDGRSMRIDIIPPFNGAAPLGPTLLRPSVAPEAFEAGCGEPVSPTPPHAVTEAAAMAVRHIIGVLSGDPESPAGELRDLG